MYSTINGPSPSNHKAKVKLILDEFVYKNHQFPRVLDVGGTLQGFAGHLPPENASLRQHITRVNPDNGHFPHINCLPHGEKPYDLAMLFGTLMYLDENEASDMFRIIFAKLSEGGTFIVAEPDPSYTACKIDNALKLYLYKFRILLEAFFPNLNCKWLQKNLPKRLVSYNVDQAIKFLELSGFKTISRRQDLAPGRWLSWIRVYYYVVVASKV